MSFEIPLRDQTIRFRDIIHLTDEQRATILEYSKEKSLHQWIESDTGIKITLNNDQKDTVLLQKNALIASRDERALLKDKTIIISQHASARIAVRIDKFSQGSPPSLDSILLVVQLVIESDIVDDKAEWKGYENLAYTLFHTGYGERFKITVSFEMIDHEHVKVITVSNEHISELTTSLMDLPEIGDKLQELKRRLMGNN